ncbi:MAG: hypothetical protein E7102_11780 [Prevotella ruminicola]|jgi:hypothetical protein|uniref:Lipoprotein n=1 Tax=Xylanibacter ruminicola TaxID=839 RepID=A0A928GHI4_XYLRU|nr:hypothetical protein [Xylanibacter ruminicola]
MKKYLIAGALALICNGLLTSCSEDLDNYSSIEEAKKAQFAQNFEKFYGTPDPNQDWGFGDASVVAARTRGVGDNSCGTCIKPDMTNYPTATAPADITDAEREYVKNWFETHPGFTEGLNISNFYVQHVWGLASKPYKVWYEHYDQNYMNNHPGATSNYYRDDYYDNGTIDYLSVGDGTNYTHLNDFNANNAGTQWKTVYMENSSALSFKYHCSWSSEEFTYFKCAEIDVPGVGKGWYVGMCMYGEKYDNGYRKINKDSLDLQYADDWIIKVIPGNGSTITTNKVSKVYKKKTVLVHKWVFCEDLGSSASNKDYDYNDLVFDAKVIDEYKVLRDADGNETAYTDDPSHTYYTEVTPLAAGGELTIKFNALSTNAHEMFNPAVASNVLVNTCRFNQEISLSHVEGRAGTTGVVSFDSYNEAIDINNVVVMVRSSQAAYELSAYKGVAPHKICVPVGTRWAYERTDIKDAYTGFPAYVDGGAEPWSTTGVEDNLYPLDGVAYEMKNDQTGTSSYEELSSSSTTEYSYTLADATNEHILWTGEVDFGNWNGSNNVTISASDLTAAEIGNGTIIRIYGVADGAFNIKAIYKDNWSDINLGDTRWITGGDNNNYSSSRVTGCIELTLNTTTATNFMTNGMTLYGYMFKALCVTYDNSNIIEDNGENNEETNEENNEENNNDVTLTNLWSGTTSYSYSENVFRPTVVSGKAIRFYGVKANTFKIYVCCGDGWRNMNVPNWGGNTAENNPSLWKNDSKGDYIEMQITDAIAETINTYGIKYQAWNITLTSIDYAY